MTQARPERRAAIFEAFAGTSSIYHVIRTIHLYRSRISMFAP
jgi:hypothetical protein